MNIHVVTLKTGQRLLVRTVNQSFVLQCVTSLPAVLCEICIDYLDRVGFCSARYGYFNNGHFVLDCPEELRSGLLTFPILHRNMLTHNYEHSGSSLTYDWQHCQWTTGREWMRASFYPFDFPLPSESQLVTLQRFDNPSCRMQILVTRLC